jgi:hypothetical protein
LFTFLQALQKLARFVKIPEGESIGCLAWIFWVWFNSRCYFLKVVFSSRNSP